MRQTITHTTKASHRPRRRGLAIVAALALIPSGHASAANVIFTGGAPGETHYQSDGITPIPTDAGFFFELGTFVNDFDPAANPTELWLENWSPVTDNDGVPLPEATTEFTELPAPLFGNYDGFNSSVELTHNNQPFPISQRGYIWGYDKPRDEAGQAQWILLTNSDDWLYPDAKNNLGFSGTWDPAGAKHAETLVGSLTGDGSAIMTFGNVTVPVPVPEPATGGLALIAGALIGIRRRRPARA